MKVLLVYLPGTTIGYGPIFPMGIGYLLAVLKQRFTTKAVHYEEMGRAWQKLPIDVSLFNPDVIGFTCSTFNRGNVRAMCKWIKTHYPNIKIILGGVHVSFLPEEAINKYKADYVVIGEGEVTMLELCSCIEKNGLPSEVKGIVYKEGNRIVKTEPRDVVENLDDLPVPDFSYAKNLMKNSGLGFVFTSRGCPNRCHFCSTGSYWGQKVRTISVKRAVDEMEIMINEYGTKKILFHDDTFNLSIPRVMRICEELLSRNLDVTWAASCRVSPVSEEMIDKMVEAGCRHICWGIESGSPRMLEKIGKKITQEQIKNAYELCRKHIGTISVGAFAMVGNPGESEETIKESVDFINTLPITDSPGAAILYILPGTKVYDSVKERHPSVVSFWSSSDGVLYPKEYDIVRLDQWARRVSQSGDRIPFDRNRHFFNKILFGNIPAPVEEEL